MDLTKKQIQNLRDVLGDNLVDADVCIYTSVYLNMLRCVFRGAPDPERLGKFTFTDSRINLMELLHVPTDVIKSVRKMRKPFFNEETGLYGVVLDLDTIFEVIGPRDP